MHKLKRHKLRNILVFFVGVILCICSGVLFYYKQSLKPVDPLNKTTQVITVTKESTASNIAAVLKERELIRSSKTFMAYVYIHNLDGSLQAGSYHLSASLSTEDIIYRLTTGIVAKEYFTILPARTIADIKKDMIVAGFNEVDVTAAFDPSLYRDKELFRDAPKDISLEGYLYPDSYEVDSSTTPKQIIEKAIDELVLVYSQQVLSATRSGLTPHKAITLASIVENEAADLSNRKKIAAVFFNRLEVGMNLGSDVTAFYGAKINGQPESVTYDSVYNTRLYDGMPPGPISAVSSTSLGAVMSPEENPYYYFVAGDDGTVYYARTLTEHENNIALYCTTACQ